MFRAGGRRRLKAAVIADSGAHMSTTLTASPPEQQSSSIVRAFRYVLGTGQRRLLREMRQHEEWIYQARTAPTVHDYWLEPLER